MNLNQYKLVLSMIGRTAENTGIRAANQIHDRTVVLRDRYNLVAGFKVGALGRQNLNLSPARDFGIAGFACRGHTSS